MNGSIQETDNRFPSVSAVRRLLSSLPSFLLHADADSLAACALLAKCPLFEFLFTNMGQKHPHPGRGYLGPAAFSTIEVMVAVLVCGVVFLGLYSGISSGFAFIQLARENLRGTQILEEKLETIRLYRWDQINQPNFIPTNFVEHFYPLATQSVGGLSYTGIVTITDAPLTEYYKDDLKQVTVDLSWVSGRAVRKRQMTSFVSHYGLQNYVY